MVQSITPEDSKKVSRNHLLQNEIHRYLKPSFTKQESLSISPVINDIPQDSIVTSKHHCKKCEIKRSKCCINFCANSVASYNLILSGDVELNLGPGSCVKNNAAKCSICNKAVGTNSKHVKCEVCQHLTHVSCLNISKMQKKKKTVKTLPLHTCTACTLTELPFHKTQNVNKTLDNETQIIPPSRDFHIDKLQANQNNASIAHLNVQALMSTFNEFSIMLNFYQFVITVVTETGLQDTIYQRDYVQVNGYNTVFKNRTGKRGSGVGFSTRCVPILHGITQIVISLLQKSVGEIKMPPPQSAQCTNTNRAQLRLRNLNGSKSLSIFQLIYTAWNGFLIVTSDFSINLLSHQNESANRYKNILLFPCSNMSLNRQQKVEHLLIT